MKSAIIKLLPAAGLIYLLLSLLYFGTVGHYGHMYPGYGLDPAAFIWFLNWWPLAIAHGLKQRSLSVVLNLQPEAGS